jgi:hypothetical protein
MAHFLKTIFKPKIFFMDHQIMKLCRVLQLWVKKIITGKENDDDNNFNHPFAIL